MVSYGPKETEKAKFELVAYTSWSLVLLFGVFFLSQVSKGLNHWNWVFLGLHVFVPIGHWIENHGPNLSRMVIELMRLVWKSRIGFSLYVY